MTVLTPGYPTDKTRCATCPLRQPVAWVPVHPRQGPLWANTISSLDSDHPAHYPLMPLYSAPVESERDFREVLESLRPHSNWLRMLADALATQQLREPGDCTGSNTARQAAQAIDAALAALAPPQQKPAEYCLARRQDCDYEHPIHERITDICRENARLTAENQRLDKSLDEAMAERDSAEDALQSAHVALGGDGEWSGKLPAQDPPNSGDLRFDVPALSAEIAAENKQLRALINNPHTDDFLEAVRLEAGHQRERWAASHDAEKTDPDWFCLVDYLAGKALSQPQKQLHHIITIAAACLNWHANKSGASTALRPAIFAAKSQEV